MKLGSLRIATTYFAASALGPASVYHEWNAVDVELGDPVVLIDDDGTFTKILTPNGSCWLRISTLEVFSSPAE